LASITLTSSSQETSGNINMGKIVVITPEQQLLLEKIKKDPFLTSHFYFTGGTALSMYYLQHRLSVDLDFFSEEKFDPQTVFDKANVLGKNLKATIEYVPIEDNHTFNFSFRDKK